MPVVAILQDGHTPGDKWRWGVDDDGTGWCTMLWSHLQDHHPTQRIITSLTSSRPPYLNHQHPLAASYVQGQLPPPLCHSGHHCHHPRSAHSLLFQAALLSQLAVTAAEMVDD